MRSAHAGAFDFGHVTLLVGNFTPLLLKFPTIRLRAPGGLTLGFAQYFLFFIMFTVSQMVFLIIVY